MQTVQSEILAGSERAQRGWGQRHSTSILGCGSSPELDTTVLLCLGLKKPNDGTLNAELPLSKNLFHHTMGMLTIETWNYEHWTGNQSSHITRLKEDRQKDSCAQGQWKYLQIKLETLLQSMNLIYMSYQSFDLCQGNYRSSLLTQHRIYF